MLHFLTLAVCIASVEIFIRSIFTQNTASLLKVTRKAIKIIPQNIISDHWKERAIPAYAVKMMQYSIKMLLVISSILISFIFADYYFDGFIDFSVSLKGILEAVVFAFGYVHLRRLFKR